MSDSRISGYTRALLPLLVVAALICGSCQPRGADAAEAGVLELSLAVPESNGERSIPVQPSTHFHVLLTNRSKQPLKIWKDSNSWGYSVLRFEITGTPGGALVIRRKERSWRKNMPTFWQLGAGETLVHDVYLGGGEWEIIPSAIHEKRVKLQAVFEVPPEEHSKSLGVWTGRLASPVRDVVFR